MIAMKSAGKRRAEAAGSARLGVGGAEGTAGSSTWIKSPAGFSGVVFLLSSDPTCAAAGEGDSGARAGPARAQAGFAFRGRPLLLNWGDGCASSPLRAGEWSGGEATFPSHPVPAG